MGKLKADTLKVNAPKKNPPAASAELGSGGIFRWN